MEKENKFTPKPWKVILLDGETYINPARGSDEYALIAKFIGTPEKKRKNATLAAASPDLLAACEAALLYGDFTVGSRGPAVRQQIREAIARAKGE